MTPSVIVETKEYLILNKPSGLVVHSDGRTKEDTLADWLVANYPAIKGVGEPWTSQAGEVIYRPGIVHRLDRETSGVIVVAKTQEMFDHLKSQFQNREVEKTYHALVYGTIKEEKGTIERPIGKSSKDFRKWSAQRGARGEMRDAVTLYKVLERFVLATLIEAKPKTGRTHQIRVHMKAINHPVVCDKLYAPNQACLYDMGRTALHAKEIIFTDLKGKKVLAEAPYPEDFKQALEKARSVA